LLSRPRIARCRVSMTASRGVRARGCGGAIFAL
jgi:hypothetical protein